MIDEFLNSNGDLISAPRKPRLSKQGKAVNRNKINLLPRSIQLAKSRSSMENAWLEWNWARRWKRWSEVDTQNFSPRQIQEYTDREPVKPIPRGDNVYVKVLVGNIANQLLDESNELFNAVLDSNGDTAPLSAYRQALRDINLQSGYPDEVVWPTIPGI